MALEKFNVAPKAYVVNYWYPGESKEYIKFYILEIQRQLSKNIYSHTLRKDEIKAVVKHFGKPSHIEDEDYIDYVTYLKKLGEW